MNKKREKINIIYRFAGFFKKVFGFLKKRSIMTRATYIDLLNTSYLKKVILLICSILLVRNFIEQNIIIPVSKWVKLYIDNNVINETVITLFLLYGFYVFISNRLKHKFISINSIIVFVIVVFSYSFFRNDYQYNFYRLFNTDIYWTDCIIVSIYLITSHYYTVNDIKVVENNNNDDLGFLEDSSDFSSDLLSRSDFAKLIGKKISVTNNTQAFAILITAEWGYGKTVFLNQIIDNIENDSQNHIIMRFDPWRSNSSQRLLESFFEDLENILSKYDSKLSDRLKSYSDSLLNVNDSIVFNALKLFLNYFFYYNSSIEQKFNYINSAIKRLNLKIIVIVDDLDRLTGDELISIVRLIRNQANFNNVFFITAFDHNYIINILKDNKYITNKEKYLEKIFQLQICLPPIRKTIIRRVFRDYLDISLPITNVTPEKEALNAAINDLTFTELDENNRLIPTVPDEFMLELFLENIRDVKRFVNSFKLTYSLIGNEVDVRDLLLLELIKYKFPNIYTILAYKSVFNNSGSRYSIDNESLKTNILNKLSALNIDRSLKGLVDKSLKLLFPIANEYRHPRSIVFPQNFEIYFNFQLENFPSLKELTVSINNGIGSMIKFIDKSVNDDKVLGILEIINSTNSYTNVNDFETIFESLFYISNTENFYPRVVPLIADILKDQVSLVKVTYSNNEEKYRDFILKVLSDGKYSHVVRSSIVLQLLRDIIYNKSNVYFKKESLLELNYKIFLDYIEKYPSNEQTVNLLYQYNYEDVQSSTQIIKISPVASKTYRSYLNEYPKYYLSIFIRPYSTPNDDEMYVLDPFYYQIFDGDNDLIEFIENNSIKKCSIFLIDKFHEFKLYNKMPIAIKDFDRINPCK